MKQKAQLKCQPQHQTNRTVLHFYFSTLPRSTALKASGLSEELSGPKKNFLIHFLQIAVLVVFFYTN